jgi:hypothetical protein
MDNIQPIILGKFPDCDTVLNFRFPLVNYVHVSIIVAMIVKKDTMDVSGEFTAFVNPRHWSVGPVRSTFGVHALHSDDILSCMHDLVQPVSNSISWI